MNVLVTHIPHAIPVVIIWGLLLRFWLAQRRLNRAEAGGGETVARPASVRPVDRPAPPVGRTVAVRGLLALGPLIGALGTGLVIYATNLGSRHAGAAAIWAHVGISLLAMLLVAYKIAEVGIRRLRAAATVERAWRTGGSLILLVLWVPLLATGVALLIFPSESSFTAYAHLIASVWWTALLLWHLRRYLVRATAVVLFDRSAATATASVGAPRPKPASPGPPPRTDRAGSRATPARPPAGRRSGSTAGRPHHGLASPIGEAEAAGVAGEDGAPAPTSDPLAARDLGRPRGGPRQDVRATATRPARDPRLRAPKTGVAVRARARPKKP